MRNKTYLGDAVYAEFDGYQIKLTTSEGAEDTNEIYLEPSVVNCLIKFIDSVTVPVESIEDPQVGA
jgi:hypothetical protein